MPTYKVTLGDKSFNIQAESPEQAATAGRLFLAGEQSIAQAEEGALARNREALDVGLDDPMSPQFQALKERATLQGTAAAAPAAAGIVGGGMLGGLIGGPALGAMAKDAAIYGAAEGAEKMLGLPSWVGEAVGAVSPAKQLGKLVLGGVFGGAAKTAAKAGAEKVAAEAGEAAAKRAAERAALEAEKVALKRRSLDIAERRLALAEQKAAKAAGKAEILPEGQRAMATNLGGKAKPGPSPTPPEKLEETLRASIEAAKSAKVSPLKGPRVQLGAQQVGRQAGMTKEEVRRATGPILGEAVGEASPILPKEPLQKIIDTMRAIPMAEREAYVARATSGKAQWQIENIRRTLEHLGLLLPAGVVAGEALGAE